MGLFGLGSKRKSLPQPLTLRLPEPGICVPAPRPGPNPLSGVEVSELNLDDDEFSSAFCTASTQFADTTPAPLDADDDDPWTSRLRLD